MPVQGIDGWMIDYNEQRSHQGRWCYGKIPMKMFLDSRELAKGKILGEA
ncbi:MAG: hypothetical protein L0Y43_11120 [Methylococcaceae bacterium]|nr:hypothetical protein [Methylococcaceae bacterium]